MAEELAALKKSQAKGKVLAIAVIAVVVVIFGLFAFSSGEDHQEFSLGSPCEKDCGRFSLDGWVCHAQDKYCTRPCGPMYKGCTEGFTCGELPGAPASSEVQGSDEKKALFCLKQ